MRAIAIIATADHVLCEDKRQSQKLLDRFGIGRSLGTYHEHNAAAERPRVLALLAAGKSVALISDAGTPLIADPGFKLVRDVVEAGHQVIAIPGPSAAITALVASGMPTDCFQFAGFLPPKSAARRSRIAELAAIPSPLVVFEAPQRLAASLGDLAAVLGDRPAAVARELTKLNEEVRRGTLSALAAWAGEREAKGEMVIVIGPPAARDATEDEIRSALAIALADASVRDAVAAVAARLGSSRARVYDLAIEMRRDSNREA